MTVVDGHRAVQLRRRLAEELATSGDLRSPGWRRAVASVPRHLFIPEFFRRVDTAQGTLWEPIAPGRVGAGQWVELAYANETWVTQLDDSLRPSDVDEPVPASPTSSSSLPGLVVRMLEDLDVHGGETVLEIGTGTGYSTALLCHRLGDENVTSIDIDPGVAAGAARALGQAGYVPTLVTGDGLAGYARHAPYDRIIATCSVRHIPQAWLAQTRRGGLVLTTLTGWLDASSGLALLEVTGHDSAEGHFLPGTISFMPARTHKRPTLGDLSHWLDRGGHEREARLSPDILDPWHWTSAFIAQLAAPTVQHVSVSVDGGPMADYIIDVENDAFAVLTPQPDGPHVVRQGGPIDLWDSIEDAILAWQRAGSPGIDTFTIRIRAGHQTISWGTANDRLTWTLPNRV